MIAVNIKMIKMINIIMKLMKKV